jgi:ubiquinone/menaquinone biosynthesis C-methylase UbiE
MISEALLARVACPVCLEASGCPSCAVPVSEHRLCDEQYSRRVRCRCGGPDKVMLERTDDALQCRCCGADYPVRQDGGYLDLTPRADLGEKTHYADHEFQERLRVRDGPPVLSARVKADMMRRMLDPRSGEAVLDLGCGAGKLAVFAGSGGARPAGVDVAPFFLPRAAREVDLVLGDLRRLPFRKASFPRAYSLDVLEHLDEGGLQDVLVESRRTVGPAGRLFVYTHAMESSRLARFQRWVNGLARRLGRAGLIDHQREAMRKSDHVNAIRSHEHFEALCAAAGLVMVERRYYNVVFKAVIEDLLLRLIEQAQRRGGKRGPVDEAQHIQGRPAAVVRAVAPGRLSLSIALGLTWLMKLDVVLFGGIRTGPFFGLLRPDLQAVPLTPESPR